MARPLVSVWTPACNDADHELTALNSALNQSYDNLAILVGDDAYYCGEIAPNYDEAGVLRDLDGSSEAGLDYAKAGILIKAIPTPEKAHQPLVSI
jgi:hypothetical protein